MGPPAFTAMDARRRSDVVSRGFLAGRVGSLGRRTDRARESPVNREGIDREWFSADMVRIATSYCGTSNVTPAYGSARFWGCGGRFRGTLRNLER